MVNDEQQLTNFSASKDFFVGIDSDGCVFDNMELKHKECFCPAFINNFDLQGVSKYARETWDFVNLYSRTRGVNRFIALVTALDILRNKTEIIDRGIIIPRLVRLEEWIEREPKLGMKALEDELKGNPSGDLRKAYQWSIDVNSAVNKIVRGVSPFSSVRSTLEKISEKADAVVVSQTPTKNIQLEWSEHNIDSYVRLIAGQEMGTKEMHIEIAVGNKYAKNNVLMIGDAPGDLKAAQLNGALFFPIIPGSEEESWKELKNNGLDRFFSGTFAGKYASSLENEFLNALPEYH